MKPPKRKQRLVRAPSGPEGPAGIVVAVEDDGIGISPELLPTVFDRFVQGSQTIERATGGLGLGLTIVKSLVTLHGGEVSARSDGINRGSQFVVRLPALEPAVLAEAPPQGPARAVVGSTLRRVLVVDDNIDAAAMLAEALEASEHEVLVAHDGPAALRAVSTFKPDAVVLDIGLPAMDGYEVARRVRTAETGSAGRVRLIALTGYGQESDRHKSQTAGMDFHLVKPVDLESLQAALAAPPPSLNEGPRSP